MPTNLIIELLILLVIGALFFYIKNFLPSYFNEKGKNLATKEDVEQITEKVEKIKSDFVKDIEFIKADLNYINQNKFSLKASERDALIELNNRYSEWLNIMMNISFTDINPQNYMKLDDYYQQIKTSRLNFYISQDKLHLFLHDEELMKIKVDCVQQTLKLEYILNNTLIKSIEHFTYHNIYFDNLSKMPHKDLTTDFILEQKKEFKKEMDKIFYKFIDDKNEVYPEVHRAHVRFAKSLKRRLYDIMN